MPVDNSSAADWKNSPSWHPEKFLEDGFLRLEHFLASDRLEEVQSNVLRFLSDVLPTLPEHQVFYEEKQVAESLKQIQQLGEFDTYFHDLLHKGVFRQVAEELLGEPSVPKNLQYISKPPQHNQPTPAHQDGFYFMLEPCAAVTLWLALDEVDDENGAVRYVPGSHESGMRPHGKTGTLGFSQGITNYTTRDWESERSISVQAGDLIAHHALTIHRADRNKSADRARRALAFIYYSTTATEDADAHAEYQARLRQELHDEGRI